MALLSFAAKLTSYTYTLAIPSNKGTRVIIPILVLIFPTTLKPRKNNAAPPNALLKVMSGLSKYVGNFCLDMKFTMMPITDARTTGVVTIDCTVLSTIPFKFADLFRER